MKVLVVGKGGREHALVWKLSQSPRTTQVYCAPGNAGTAEEGINVPIESNDIDKLLRFAQKEHIALTVVGPEEPLALGIVDRFQQAGQRIFGPSKEAAQLEASKAFAKQLMRHADIPTAEFRLCDHPEHARHYIRSREHPLVVKADGLAAGKGVMVCSTREEALHAIERIMVREEFGRAAGRQVVIEKRLEGEDLSILAVVSGRTILPLPVSQDHKRAGDNDTGPNTGGMGAYCPAPLASESLQAEIEETVLVPTIHAMKRARKPFKGLLYTGIMVTPQGPRVLEYNCRFGDPEAQPLLMRLQTDLLDLLEAVVDERLEEYADGGVRWDPRPSVCVVMASKGYPGNYEKGHVITGLRRAAELPDVKVFHAGTRLDNGRVLTDGGRVLGVTALGDTLADAQRKVYEAVRCIEFPGAFYRTDIGARAKPHGPEGIAGSGSGESKPGETAEKQSTKEEASAETGPRSL